MSTWHSPEGKYGFSSAAELKNGANKLVVCGQSGEKALKPNHVDIGG